MRPEAKTLALAAVYGQYILCERSWLLFVVGERWERSWVKIKRGKKREMRETKRVEREKSIRLQATDACAVSKMRVDTIVYQEVF